MDDEIAGVDDLFKLGFDWSLDGESVFISLGSGLEIDVGINTNTKSDEFNLATSLSLYWKIQPKVSGHYGIRDDPTIAQVRELLKALKGE